MTLKSDEITALLRSKPTTSYEDGVADSVSEASSNTTAGVPGIPGVPMPPEPSSVRRSCDVGYVIFLEPPDEDNPGWSTVEWLADRAIRMFSPTPTMAHVELVIPPIPDSDGGKVHFATYLGAAGANWQNSAEQRAEGIEFYLVANGARWRCIPVFAPAVADSLRSACDANLHAPYSIGMYPTSARPLRKLAWLWGDAPKHMGHCATITTRVLKEAGAGYALPHASAWYCPSSLYTALNTSLSTRLDENERSNLNTVEPEVCQQTIESLLRGQLSYKTVRDLGDARCVDAIRALTMRVVAAADRVEEDPNTARVAQKELASAVLRWVLLRADPSYPD